MEKNSSGFTAHETEIRKLNHEIGAISWILENIDSNSELGVTIADKAKYKTEIAKLLANASKRASEYVSG